MKRCTACHADHPPSGFYSDGARPRRECKRCFNAIRAQRRPQPRAARRFCPQCGSSSNPLDSAGWCAVNAHGEGCDEHLERFDAATGARLVPVAVSRAVNPWDQVSK